MAKKRKQPNEPTELGMTLRVPKPGGQPGETIPWEEASQEVRDACFAQLVPSLESFAAEALERLNRTMKPKWSVNKFRPSDFEPAAWAELVILLVKSSFRGRLAPWEAADSQRLQALLLTAAENKLARLRDKGKKP